MIDIGDETGGATDSPDRSVTAKRAWIAMHAAVGAAILFVACSPDRKSVV